MAFERTEGSRPARPMRRGRKKVCSFCVDRIDTIDYKDVPRLRKYVSERAKIIPRRVTGTCAYHQRALTIAIKRARHVACSSAAGRSDALLPRSARWSRWHGAAPDRSG